MQKYHTWIIISIWPEGEELMMGLCFIIIIHFEFLNDKNVTI